MAVTLILHITDEDPVVGEAEEIPSTVDYMVQLTNPRRLDGKELHYLNPGIAEVIWPMHRINFIEIVPAEEDDIVGFVRE